MLFLAWDGKKPISDRTSQNLSHHNAPELWSSYNACFVYDKCKSLNKISFRSRTKNICVCHLLDHTHNHNCWYHCSHWTQQHWPYVRDHSRDGSGGPFWHRKQQQLVEQEQHMPGRWWGLVHLCRLDVLKVLQAVEHILQHHFLHDVGKMCIHWCKVCSCPVILFSSDSTDLSKVLHSTSHYWLQGNSSTCNTQYSGLYQGFCCLSYQKTLVQMIFTRYQSSQ